jgi:hypothetical protein
MAFADTYIGCFAVVGFTLGFSITIVHTLSMRLVPS